MTDHPRHKSNVDGAWYATGECMACGAPEEQAPTLLAGLSDENLDTFFVRQPSTEAEVEQACRAAEVCCVNAIRYGGNDQGILSRLSERSELLDNAPRSGSSPRDALHPWQRLLRRER
jgi:hypothetical protein